MQNIIYEQGIYFYPELHPVRLNTVICTYRVSDNIWYHKKYNNFAYLPEIIFIYIANFSWINQVHVETKNKGKMHFAWAYYDVYTLNRSSKWYIVYICRVFQKGLNADKFYHDFDFLYTINICNVVFIHFKSS